jgi:3D-(3,5/4)-trihydroxycyclohexane-1,2-dione acylhydrolase (decyclizing)
VFADPEVRFVNLNVTGFDAGNAAALVADARPGLEALTGALDGYRTGGVQQTWARELSAAWQQQADRAYHLGHQPKPGQTEEDRRAERQSPGSGTWSCRRLTACPATCSGWRARTPRRTTSVRLPCMGYEIAAGGARWPTQPRGVVLVGDGST